MKYIQAGHIAVTPPPSQKLASFTRIILSSSAGLHVKYIHDIKESITMHVHVEFTSAYMYRPGLSATQHIK